MQVLALCQEEPQRRKCQPTLVFLPGRSHGVTVRHDWAHILHICVCLCVYIYTWVCIYITEKMWVPSLGQKGPLEKETATHSSTLAWKVPWTEEPSRLQLMGSQKSLRDLQGISINTLRIAASKGSLRCPDVPESSSYTNLPGIPWVHHSLMFCSPCSLSLEEKALSSTFPN